MKHFRLGASNYVPATHSDITIIANGKKFNAKSIIFCTEDSVLEKDVPYALDNLKHMLANTTKSEKMLKFIRVRNEAILEQILTFDGINNIDGFVFPKITQYNFLNYMDKFKGHCTFDIMPTLETREVFCLNEMVALRNIFEIYKDNILSLRIGGNDLLHLLGIRRSKHRTIYETPVGVAISNLVSIFKPYGYNLTSPVCELLADSEILLKEVPLDQEHGLFGKTAIHPDQIPMIEQFYKVSLEDVEMAHAILHPQAKAVFKMHGTMCEVATHFNWAKEILARAEIYGIIGINK
jgi:citrate lyase beta subunit